MDCTRLRSTPSRLTSRDGRGDKVLRVLRRYARACRNRGRGRQIRPARGAARRTYGPPPGPLAAFILTLLFAAILALTGFISRRAAEISFLVAACAFMIQRLWTHQRIWGARKKGRAEIERLMSGPVTTTIEADGVTQANAGGVWRLLFLDCVDAEESGGLHLSVGARGSASRSTEPPSARGQAARLLTWFRGRVQRS